jgi:hypothetical protein
MNATLTDNVIPLSVNLGDQCVWTDEWAWTPVPQKVRYAVDGTMVVETISPHAAGQPITLSCSWQGKNNIDNIKTLRDRVNQAVMTLVLCDGQIKSVVFNHEQIPVEIVPIKELSDGYIVGDFFDVTMRFLIT